MKKFLASTLAVAMFAVSAPSAQAAVATQAFNVTANLTAICTVGAIPDLAFTYTAFQAAAATTSTAFAITCTRGLVTPTYAFDTSSFGVVAGLNYELSTTATAPSGGTEPTATLGSIGTPDNYTVTIAGNMPAAQAGNSAALATQVRTITITY